MADKVPAALIGEIYLRKSRALGDPDDPELLAQLLQHHRAALLRLAEADGVHVPPEHIIEEIGSAERIEDRPKFRAKVEQWEQGRARATVFYVTEISRLSRGSSAQWGRIEEALRSAGVKVRTRSRLFDVENPEDCNWLEIEALFGRMELRYMKLRAAAKRVEMVRDGLIRTGAAPWGYAWDKPTKTLVPDPERFPVLQRLCREILTVSAHRLSRQYGIPQSSLLWTLKNPAICGWPAQRYSSGTAARRGTAARLPREQWIWPERPGTYPPACTRPEWDAIQIAIEQRYLRREKTTATGGWCRDVVQFAGATGRLSLGAVRPPGQAGYYSYDLSRPGQPRLSVDRELIHAAADQALTALFTQPDALFLALDAYQEQARQTLLAPATACRDPETLRRFLARERGRLAGLKREEWDPEEDDEDRTANRAAQEQVKQSIVRLKLELQQAEQHAARVPALEQVWEELAPLAHAWAAIWPDCAEELKRSLTNACLEAIQVTVDAERHGRSFRREVTGVTYSEWLRRFLE